MRSWRFLLLVAALCLAGSPGLARGEGAVRGFCRAGSVCWAVGDGGLVLCSDDAGATWRRVELSGLPGEEAATVEVTNFSAAHFSDETTGCLFGGRGIPGHPGGASVGVICSTADGGKRWKLTAPEGVAALRGGWIDGERGIVFGEPTRSRPSGTHMTVTGGKIFNPLATASPGAILGGAFAGIDEACLVGPAHRIVSIRSLGEPRDRPPAVASSAALLACCVSPGRWWAVGENGSAFVIARAEADSPGLGAPEPLSLPLPARTRRLADLEAVASAGQTVWMAGGLTGLLFRARDGARTMEALPAPGPGPVHALAALSETVLLAGGDGGRIWRSQDAGKIWTLVRGSPSVDVLFVAGPADVSLLPALVAHARAGAEVSVVFAAVPSLLAAPQRQEGGSPAKQAPRGETFLRFAAAAAGTGGTAVLSDFASVADDEAAAGLDAEGIIRRWLADLDVPAREEMLRQLAAAVRLYRPKVVALGPDGYEGKGAAAENHLVSRLAREAVKLAGQDSAASGPSGEGALPELAQAGLKPWTVARIFTGLDDNERYVPPWAPPPARAGQEVATRLLGWGYPEGSPTSLSMLAMRAAWLLPWVGPMDRPAEFTAYGCRPESPSLPLFTSRLAASDLPEAGNPPPGRLSLRTAPMGEGLASGATLRAAVLLGQKPATVAGPLLQAAKDYPRDPLPADLLGLLHARLLETARLSEAADIQQALLSLGAAHPLYARQNVAAITMAFSLEWRQQALALPAMTGGPAPARPEDVPVRVRLPDPAALKPALQRLTSWPWSAWVDDEEGLTMLARACAVLGDYEAARLAYKRLARATGDPRWARFAQVELTGLGDPAAALAQADGLILSAGATRLTVDARLEEDFWPAARRHVLAPVGRKDAAPPVSVRMAATPDELAVAVEIDRAPRRPPAAKPPPAPATRRSPPSIFQKRPDEAAAPAWKLAAAIDADHDACTQLLLECDSAAGRSLRLLTRLAPPATLGAGQMPVQARQDGQAWTIELAVPRRLIGLAADEGGVIRMQLAISAGSEGAEPAWFYLAPQADPRLLPHRYALVAVPPAAAGR